MGRRFKPGPRYSRNRTIPKESLGIFLSHLLPVVTRCQEASRNEDTLKTPRCRHPATPSPEPQSTSIPLADTLPTTDCARSTNRSAVGEGMVRRQGIKSGTRFLVDHPEFGRVTDCCAPPILQLMEPWTWLYSSLRSG